MSTVLDDDKFSIVELVSCGDLMRANRPIAEMAFRRDAWTPTETATLKRLFAEDIAIAAIAATLGRGPSGVTDKIMTLGLRRHSVRPWCDIDDAVLHARYGLDSAAAIAAQIGRSCTAVYARATYLGLAEASAPPWTPWEDSQLGEGYRQALPVAQIATLIGRTLSAVASRASLLQLSHPNQPKGWSDAETCRALELVQSGLRYKAVMDQLATEGFPTRTKAAFNPKIRKLGYGRGWGRAWTAEEDALLEQSYKNGTSLTPLRERLGRTPCSIRWRATYLELRGNHPNKNGFRGGPDWSADDLDILRAEYGSTPVADLARKLGRTKAAVFTRANVLKLVHGYIKPWTAEDIAALGIAYETDVAIADLAIALDRKAMSVSKYATKHGYDFGRRRRAAHRLTRADILAMADANPRRAADHKAEISFCTAAL